MSEFVVTIRPMGKGESVKTTVLAGSAKDASTWGVRQALVLGMSPDQFIVTVDNKEDAMRYKVTLRHKSGRREFGTELEAASKKDAIAGAILKMQACFKREEVKAEDLVATVEEVA